MVQFFQKSMIILFVFFSHVEPSHITYHLASKDISINEEALILKGNAKKTFNELIKLDI